MLGAEPRRQITPRNEKRLSRLGASYDVLSGSVAVPLAEFPRPIKRMLLDLMRHIIWWMSLLRFHWPNDHENKNIPDFYTPYDMFNEPFATPLAKLPREINRAFPA